MKKKTEKTAKSKTHKSRNLRSPKIKMKKKNIYIINTDLK